jgi:Zn-finger nucleic acid-binding protein
MPQTWDDVTAFQCKGCHGHFVPGSALESFLTKHNDVRAHGRLLEKASGAPLTTRSLTCPHCRTRTYHAVQMGLVEIDVCNTCGGVFLDQDEAVLYFRQVRAHTTAGNIVAETWHAADFVRSLGHFIHGLLH